MSELIASDWLKARNWTEAAIKRFLGEPDDTKPNPHYKSGPPMRLWLKERAEAVEQTEEFKAWMLKSLERSARAKDAARKRMEALWKEVQDWTPTLNIPEGDLVKLACEHYNALHFGRGKYANTSDSPEFLRRIVGNYLRHECSDYEEMLSRIRGKPGVENAYQEIRAEALMTLDIYVHEAMAARGLLEPEDGEDG